MFDKISIILVYLFFLIGIYQPDANNFYFQASLFTLFTWFIISFKKVFFDGTYFFYFILHYTFFEGLIRKWVLPSLEKEVFLIKIFLIIFFCLINLKKLIRGYNFFPKDFKNVFVIFTAYLIFHLFNFINYNIFQFGFGVFSYLIGLVFLFIICGMEKINYIKFEKLLFLSVFLILFSNLILIETQRSLSPTHWLNQGLELKNDIRVSVNSIRIGENKRVLGTFSFLNWYYHIVFCGFIIASSYFFEKRFKKSILVFLLIVTILSFFYTGSRKVFGMLFIAIVMGAYLFGSNFQYKKQVLGFIGLIVILNYSFPNLIKTIKDRIYTQEGEIRVNTFNRIRQFFIFNTTLNEFKIIGEGPGTVNKQSYVVGNKIAPSLATKKRMIYGNEEGHWKTLGEIGLIGMLLYYFLHFRIIFLLSKLSLFGRKTYFLGVAACLFHVFTLWATYFQVLFVQFMVFGFSGIVLAILQENRHRKINNNIA